MESSLGDISELAGQIRDLLGPSHVQDENLLRICISMLIDEKVNPESLAYIVRELPKTIARRRR